METMELEQTARPASLSRVRLSIVIMPGEANHYGTTHGGVLLRLADECGAIAALRHVGRGQITTAAMDSMTFLGPVFVGERVEMFAEVTYAGRTSVESRIDVYAEPLEKAEPRKVGVGYCLYVALDEGHLDEGQRPLRVPPLLSETEADHRRDQAAAARQEIRQARRREAQAEQAQAEQSGKS